MVEGFSFVAIDVGFRIVVNAKTVPEAKIALKELKLLKKALASKKRGVMEEERVTRAEYTDGVRRRPAKMRGSSIIAKMSRATESLSRASARQNLAGELAPHEREKGRIEANILAVEQAILRLESQISRGQGLDA